MKTERSHLFDNAKFLLMLLVVLGHAMEVTGDEGTVLYKFIYLSHMPAFVLVAGYFSKHLKPRAIFTPLWQYLLFQALYCLFSAFALGRPLTWEQSLTTPYWILWFLFSMMVWKLVTPLLLRSRAHPVLVIGLAVTLALLSDLVKGVDYEFSLSRTLQFFPFFLLGAYLNEGHFHALRRVPKWLAAAGLLSAPLWLAGVARFSHWVLYGTLAYEQLHLAPDDGILLVLSLFIWGAVLIGCFFVLVPARETIFSEMGRNTLPCYLIHGFMMRTLDVAGFGEGLGLAGKLLFYLGSLLFALVLMSAPVAAVMRPVLGPGFLAGRRRRVRAGL